MKVVLSIMLILCLAGCDIRGDTESTPFTLTDNSPNSFIQFLNPQASMAQGEYQLYVLPQAQAAGTFSGSVTLIQGNLSSQVEVSGEWSAAIDIDWSTTNQTPTLVEFDQVGGIEFSIECSQACTAYLIKNDFVYQTLASVDNVIEKNLPANQLNSLEYATAYYDAVDPNSTRVYLSDWKQVNGFDDGETYHVIFRDSKDLGYGRDMHIKQLDDGRVAFFVNNFVVKQGDGDPANYGPLNLYAAVDQNGDYFLGTNAIEFSPIEYKEGETPVTPDTDYILKFFIYGPKDEEGEQERLLKADLDGRGEKFMPTICLLCHGARLLPLNSDGTFDTLSLKAAKPNQLEVDSFEFMPDGTYAKSQQESDIANINEIIHGIFSGINERSNTEKGYWDASFAQDIAQGRYDGFTSNEFIETDIPQGWQQTDARPEGIETLYKQVIEPHCISCHSLRGFNAGNDENLDTFTINDQVVKTGTAINFSSYEKFIGYNDIIIDYVYRRGVMPLSLRNYEQFWLDPDGAPSLLASFLIGFDVLNDEGKVEEAGKAVARFGRNRTAKSPVKLDASGSYFADDYAWEIIASPANSTASLSSETHAITELTADIDGDYTIRLTVSNAYGDSTPSTDSKDVVITVDSSLAKHGSELNFVEDIRPILQNTVLNGRTCHSCHFAGSNIEGIPVYWDDNNERLYADIKARVDLKDADNSILIRKPTRLQHGGGALINLSNETGFNLYSTLMDWITHGAVCGEGVFCDE